jgi:hypothetical protein
MSEYSVPINILVTADSKSEALIKAFKTANFAASRSKLAADKEPLVIDDDAVVSEHDIVPTEIKNNMSVNRFNDSDNEDKVDPPLATISGLAKMIDDNNRDIYNTQLIIMKSLVEEAFIAGIYLGAKLDYKESLISKRFELGLTLPDDYRFSFDEEAEAELEKFIEKNSQYFAKENKDDGI